MKIRQLAKDFVLANEEWLKISLWASTSHERNKTLCRQSGLAWDKKNKAYNALKKAFGL